MISRPEVIVRVALAATIAVGVIGSMAAPALARQAAGIDDKFFREGGPLDAGSGSEVAGSDAAAGSAAGADNVNEATTPREAPSPASLEPGELAGTAGRVIGALAFVSILIVVISKMGKKAKLPFFASSTYVKRIAVEPIGPNQFIQLLEVGGRVIVVGLWDKGMTKLAELDGEALDRIRLKNSEDVAREEKTNPGWFGHVLKSVGGYLHTDEKALASEVGFDGSPVRRGRGDGRLETRSAHSKSDPLTKTLVRERRRVSEMVL